MTKRDYIILAAAIAKASPAESESERDCIIAAIADALARDNTRFDRGRFILACME